MAKDSFWSRIFGGGSPAPVSPEEAARREAVARQIADEQAAMMAALPFERVATTSHEALATWERLRQSKTGWPVVIGDDRGLLSIAQGFAAPGPSVEEDLALAATLHFPDSLRLHRKEEWRLAAESLALLRREGKKLPAAFDLREDLEQEAPVGTWPDEAGAAPGLSVAFDHRGNPLEKVHILIVPTNEGAEVPALLRWGGWNDCPPPAQQVAALRSWHERYGVELVGIGGDVLNLRASRRPQTREEALALAREQCLYCSDIVFQGTDTLSNLAATLMADDWWYFWWD